MYPDDHDNLLEPRENWSPQQHANESTRTKDLQEKKRKGLVYSSSGHDFTNTKPWKTWTYRNQHEMSPRSQSVKSESNIFLKRKSSWIRDLIIISPNQNQTIKDTNLAATWNESEVYRLSKISYQRSDLSERKNLMDPEITKTEPWESRRNDMIRSEMMHRKEFNNEHDK